MLHMLTLAWRKQSIRMELVIGTIRCVYVHKNWTIMILNVQCDKWGVWDARNLSTFCHIQTNKHTKWTRRVNISDLLSFRKIVRLWLYRQLKNAKSWSHIFLLIVYIWIPLVNQSISINVTQSNSHSNRFYEDLSRRQIINEFSTKTIEICYGWIRVVSCLSLCYWVDRISWKFWLNQWFTGFSWYQFSIRKNRNKFRAFVGILHNLKGYC